MKYQGVIYTILGLVVVAVIGVVFYATQFVFKDQPITDTSSNPVSLDITKTSGGKKGESFKVTRPFYLKQSSEEYKVLSDMYGELATSMARSTLAEQKQAYVDSYGKFIAFYNDKKHSERERAYALNMLTLVFIVGFDADALQEGLKADKVFSAEFAKNLAHARSFKKREKGQSGTMFSTGTADMNYAAQKTVAHLNALAFDLYPSSYALLRNNLNTMQADFLLYTNFQAGKRYKNSALMMTDLYGKSYFIELDKKIADIEGSNRLYEDTYASSYEIDIMYSSGVIWSEYQLIAADPTKKKEAERLLKEYIMHANHMVQASDEYTTGRLFYGYVLSAFSKYRAANEAVFTDVEKKTLKAEAVKTFVNAMHTVKNSQFRYWLGHLPKTGWMQKELNSLAADNDEIAQFVNAL